MLLQIVPLLLGQLAAHVQLLVDLAQRIVSTVPRGGFLRLELGIAQPILQRGTLGIVLPRLLLHRPLTLKLQVFDVAVQVLNRHDIHCDVLLSRLRTERSPASPDIPQPLAHKWFLYYYYRQFFWKCLQLILTKRPKPLLPSGQTTGALPQKYAISLAIRGRLQYNGAR